MTGTPMEVQVHMAPNREMPPLKSPDLSLREFLPL